MSQTKTPQAFINQVPYELDLDVLKVMYDDYKNNPSIDCEADDDISTNDWKELNDANNKIYESESSYDIDKDMKAIIEALKNSSPNKKAKIIKMIELFEDEK